MVLFQVIADLFGIVDLVALAGLFNLFRMCACQSLQPQTRSGSRPRADVKGRGRRRWMPDMLASSPTCSVEGLMDDLA